MACAAGYSLDCKLSSFLAASSMVATLRENRSLRSLYLRASSSLGVIGVSSSMVASLRHPP